MHRSAAWARRRRTRSAASRSISRTRSDMNAARHDLPKCIPQTIEFQLDGHTVQAFEGETILQAARARTASTIPRLCYKEGYRPDGNCRACVVEIKGERTLAPSCCRARDRRHGGAGDERARAEEPEDGGRDAALRHAGRGLQVDRRRRHAASTASSASGPRASASTVRPELKALAPRAAGVRSLASGDGRQPRRLHPVQPLRARLPRGAGQRRHRLRVPRRAQRRSCST